MKRRNLLLLVLWMALLATPKQARSIVEPLTLRVNDGVAVPGGVLAVVVRTYSPRGVGQGQICLRRTLSTKAQASIESQPLAELLEAHIFSDAGDAAIEASFDVAAQELMLDFSSASASINRTDGPMLALLFRVGDEVPAGTAFAIEVDGAVSQLFDQLGGAIEIEPRGGNMSIRSLLGPYQLEASGGNAAPANNSESAIVTAESQPLAGGTVVFLYDPAVVLGEPQVSLAPRLGNATVDVINLQPGRVEVGFSSPDHTFNRIPGELVRIALPIAPGVVLGETSPVSLESGTTVLFDAEGAPLTLVLEGGALLFVDARELAMFYDGFESGDVTSWCLAVGVQ